MRDLFHSFFFFFFFFLVQCMIVIANEGSGLH